MLIHTAVPTNIVTGALGVGKTTFIKALLKAKPANERWAVLINEFGEIGVDATMLIDASFSTHTHTANQHIFVREVPGGCMCCTSGLSMQIALNQLLAAAKPHRLIIEPSGLGHPKEVLQILRSAHYNDVIKLENTFCLSDARKLSDARWREHPTFIDQFEVANCIVLTKTDLYGEGDIPLFNDYMHTLGLAQTPVISTYENSADAPKRAGLAGEKSVNLCFAHSHEAQVLLAILSNASLYAAPPEQKSPALLRRTNAIVKTEPIPSNAIQDAPTTSNEIIRKDKASEGFHSRGWVWPPDICFDYDSLMAMLARITVLRLKAVFITYNGIFSVNLLDTEVKIMELDEAMDSRLEFIATTNESAEHTQAILAEYIPLSS